MASLHQKSIRTDSFDVSISVETPEQIALSYSRAGLGSRGIAVFLDYLFCLILWIGITLLFAYALDRDSVPQVLEDAFEQSESWFYVLYLVMLFVLQWGYFVLCEALFDGQTLGKRLLRLRTVQDGGFAVSAGASAIRNLLRVIDSQPFPSHMVGVITVLLNKSGKRLGDLVAGTFVVRESIPETLPSVSSTGATSLNQQAAIGDAELAKWQAFETRLKATRRRGLAGLPAQDVSDFVAQYREMTTDYARQQTANQQYLSGPVFYLSRLISSAHSLLYQQRGIALKAMMNYLFLQVPAEIRRSWRPIMLAAMFFFGPAIVSYVVITKNPQTIPLVMPEEMISRATTAADREAEGKGYIDVSDKERPVLAGFVTTNNLQVTFFAFAAGITAGIGTLFILLNNGIMIGSSVGLFAVHDVARVLINFVAPHTVFELSAICIGSAGGLLIAAAMWLPGRRTRRQAFIENGRRAITLVAGASLLLLCAGALEGLISPRVWPLQWKLWVGAATAVLFIAYVTLGMGKSHNQSNARSLISR